MQCALYNYKEKAIFAFVANLLQRGETAKFLFTECWLK